MIRGRKPVIAIVFDGGVVVDRREETGSCEPLKVGEFVPGAIKFIRGFKTLGAKIVIVTTRTGVSLEAAKEACYSAGIKVDSWTVRYPDRQAHVIIDPVSWGTPTYILPPKKKNISKPHPVNWDVLGGNVLEYVRRKTHEAEGPVIDNPKQH